MTKNQHRHQANIWREQANKWLDLTKRAYNSDMRSRCLKQYYACRRDAEYHDRMGS